jgi:hypothetical protein
MLGDSPRSDVDRRTVLETIGGGSLAVVGFGGTVSGKPGGGPTGTKNCDLVVPDDESSIQAGVDAASAGDTVCVKAGGGPYEEQVVVNKDLTLRGVNEPTIRGPSDPSEFTIPESGPTFEPAVFAFGGDESGGSVSGGETVDVTVTGFDIDGEGEQPEARRGVGVLARNVSGAVSGNTVRNMGVGGKETFGILAYGDSELEILDNDVSEYERGGIGVVGDGGAHPSPTAEVRGNTVTGSTGIGQAWGPNGIQVGYGAGGKIVDNEVTDNRYAEEAFTAAGIIVFESDDIQVKGNAVTNSDVGIAVGSWGWFRGSADNAKVTKNEVHEANAGVLLRAVAYDGFSGRDSSVSNAKVVNNEISDPDPDDDDAGIAVQAIDSDPDYDPTADNNKVVRNTITGFEDQVIEGGSDTKLQAIEP